MGVVVPCKNEGGTIERCLRSIRAQQPAPARLIVVDNGSTDNSLAVAEELADEVLPIHTGSISYLRNSGAAALGDVDVIAFVDADVELGPDWLSRGLLELETAQLVGSRNDATPGGPWVASRWAAIEAATVHADSRIWSQSLLITRDLFERLNGFDEDLPTGEDSDLSARAAELGSVVRASSSMRAIHHGFPGTVRTFLKRERWHTRHPGWFPRMSRKSQTLVVCGAVWAGLGAVALTAAARGNARPGLAWTLASLAGVPALGRVAGAGRSIPDGVLMALWAGVRVSRLPREVFHREPARSGCGGIDSGRDG